MLLPILQTRSGDGVPEQIPHCAPAFAKLASAGYGTTAQARRDQYQRMHARDKRGHDADMGSL
jgi:hypothetical protein